MWEYASEREIIFLGLETYVLHLINFLNSNFSSFLSFDYVNSTPLQGHEKKKKKNVEREREGNNNAKLIFSFSTVAVFMYKTI